MLPKLKRRFNLFEDVLVLIVRPGGGEGKGVFYIYFLALPTSCSPVQKNKLNYLKAKP